MKVTHHFRAFARSLIAVFGALTLPLSAFAGSITGEPTAALSASFDGDTTVTGWFTGWGGTSAMTAEDTSVYVTSTYGQAFTVVTNAHPYDNVSGGYSGKTSSSFSIALYADGDNIVTSSGGTTLAFSEESDTTPRILWGMGRNTSGIALAKTSATTYALIRITENTTTGFTTLSSATVTGSGGGITSLWRPGMRLLARACSMWMVWQEPLVTLIRPVRRLRLVSKLVRSMVAKAIMVAPGAWWWMNSAVMTPCSQRKILRA